MLQSFHVICFVLQIVTDLIGSRLTLPHSFASPTLRADLPVRRLGDERREMSDWGRVRAHGALVITSRDCCVFSFGVYNATTIEVW